MFRHNIGYCRLSDTFWDRALCQSSTNKITMQRQIQYCKVADLPKGQVRCLQSPRSSEKKIRIKLKVLMASKADCQKDVWPRPIWSVTSPVTQVLHSFSTNIQLLYSSIIHKICTSGGTSAGLLMHLSGLRRSFANRKFHSGVPGTRATAFCTTVYDSAAQWRRHLGGMCLHLDACRFIYSWQNLFLINCWK